GEMPDGWTRVDATTATYTVTLLRASCEHVSPVAPTITEAECVDGALTEPTLDLPTSGGGITYSVDVDPPYAAGQTVVGTATLDETGVAWSAELPEGWFRVNALTATFSVTFAEVPCPPPTTAPETTEPSVVTTAPQTTAPETTEPATTAPETTTPESTA